MKNEYQLSDDQFSRAFETATLNPKLFNHKAHLRLAYLLITVNGIDSVIDKCCKQILAYATSLEAKFSFLKPNLLPFD
jgi:hypothetical protein